MYLFVCVVSILQNSVGENTLYSTEPEDCWQKSRTFCTATSLLLIHMLPHTPWHCFVADGDGAPEAAAGLSVAPAALQLKVVVTAGWFINLACSCVIALMTFLAMMLLPYFVGWKHRPYRSGRISPH